jgi:eight-cysteine-cluster-containing protein
MKAKTRNWTPKFITLAVFCLLIGVGIGLLGYHYFLKPVTPSDWQSTKIEPTKEVVENIYLIDENGKREIIDLKSEEGIGLASLLTRKLHELNLQAPCVFSGRDIQEIKQKDKVVDLTFKNPINITISQWVEPEERYHIPVDEKRYRILENVKTALFILEDNLDEGLEGHILVGSEREERTERCSWKVTEKDREKYKELGPIWSMIAGYEFDEERGCIPVGGSKYIKDVVPFKTKEECELACGRMWSCWAIQQEGSRELDKTWIKQIEKTLTLEEFCGWSTYGNCSSDSDCTAGGCSGQVCQSKYEEPVITTCEWRDCFDASKYGLKCRCIDGRCQWSEIEPTKEVPTMADIPHLNLTPQLGEYFTYRGNKSQILLNDSRLKYCFLELKDICPPNAANVGDLGIVIAGTIKNEYGRDYYICMAAHAFNSEGEQIGGSIDPGPVCGMIAPYVKSGQTRDFELHLKYREDIERIELFVGCVSEIPPP